MTAHKYKTDLRCGACVNRIGPLLDAAPDIVRWSADVTDPNKVLTVEGDVTAERVADVIGPAGYHVLGELREEKEKPAVHPPPLRTITLRSRRPRCHAHPRRSRRRTSHFSSCCSTSSA